MVLFAAGKMLKRGPSCSMGTVLSYNVSRDRGIHIGEEYTYGLMPLLISDETRPLFSVF